MLARDSIEPWAMLSRDSIANYNKGHYRNLALLVARYYRVWILSRGSSGSRPVPVTHVCVCVYIYTISKKNSGLLFKISALNLISKLCYKTISLNYKKNPAHWKQTPYKIYTIYCTYNLKSPHSWHSNPSLCYHCLYRDTRTQVHTERISYYTSNLSTMLCALIISCICCRS